MDVRTVRARLIFLFWTLQKTFIQLR